MSPPSNSEPLLQQLEQALRRLSAQGVILSEAVAARRGLSITELECLELIALRSQVIRAASAGPS